MTTLTAVNARITGDSTGLQTALDRASTKLQAFGRQTRQVINSVAKWGAAVAAAGAAVGIALVRRSLEAIDAQAKLARSLNTTTSSVAALARAGQLSGVAMSGIEQATKDLTRRLSQAAGGTGPAADALDRLGLSAQELSMMPLDERVAKINGAIRQFIPAAEQAAVAGQLFGEEGSIAMSRIDPETIAKAAREVSAFGTAVSQVDAANVERANDAMSVVGEVVRGVGNRIATQLAPLIEAIATSFRDTAVESEGFGSTVSGVISGLLKGIGFFADAVHGITVIVRSVQLAFQTMAARTLGVFAAIEMGVESIADILGIEYDAEQTFMVKAARAAQAAVNDTKQSLVDLGAQPLPSEKFEKWAASVTEAARITSERALGMRDSLQLIELPDIAMKEGRSEEEAEAHQQQITDRLERVRQGLLSEAELQQEGFQLKQEVLAEALANELLTEEQHREMLQALEEQHSNKMSSIRERGLSDLDKITRQSYAKQASFVAQGFADMTAAAASGNKAMFELNKVAAIASGLLDLKEAVTGAYKVGARIGGPPLGAAYAAVAGATQLAQLNSIRSQSFGGGGSTAPSVSQTPAPAVTPVGGNQQGGNTGGGSSRTVAVSGITAGDLFTGRQLIDLINDATEDGSRLVLVD